MVLFINVIGVERTDSTETKIRILRNTATEFRGPGIMIRMTYVLIAMRHSMNLFKMPDTPRWYLALLALWLIGAAVLMLDGWTDVLPTYHVDLGVWF